IGPFYCPLDEKIFIDTDFFDIMEQQLGAEDGTLAELYVLAHEYGHHIQNVYGVLEESQKDPKGADSGAVRVELMADCFAGMWIKAATTTTDAQGEPLLTEVSEEDVTNAMGAAKSVGDDEIQKKSGGGVDPEGWTHGSAEARQAWLLRGMGADSVSRCDTFAVEDPNSI
ncbi:MAG TPA: neutral zinc metallopeptidase, partial [Candidatus Janibacter merdipullorum]|nr:neutral zinc metallopeptidase [Candidatus Janibacter merdipullorum]